MKFALQINCSPYQNHTAITALRFAQTLVTLQQELLRVFFYHDGIYHAFAHATPPDDEIQLTAAWSQLAQQHGVDLVVCISAAQRRGLLSAEEAAHVGKTDADLANGFRISGLGQWVEATLLADRLVLFG